MTLVIRSADALATPPRGSKVLPPLSVAGALHRWHADYFTDASGAAVASVPDLVGDADLAPSGTVTAVLDDATTDRAIKVTGTGRLDSPSGIAIPDAYTVAARVYLTENPASVAWMIATATSGTTPGIAAMSSGVFRAYGGTTTTYPQSAAVTKPAWVTIVATFDRLGTAGKIAVNGGTPVANTQTWSGAVTGQVRLTGNGLTNGVKFREVVIVNGVLSDANMALLAADIT